MYASIEGSGESSLCSCVDAIEHYVAHNFDKIFFFLKNLMCWHISLSLHVSLLLDQASSNRFEFGSGRFFQVILVQGSILYYLGIKMMTYE